MERKYKQRGYMQEGEESRRERTPRPPKSSGIRRYGMRDGGTARSGIRCARCAKVITSAGEVSVDSVCENCGADLHTCTNCAFFKTSARYECSKPIAVRVAPKDVRSDCSFFSPTVFVERTFESRESAPQDARKAFEALFKK